MVHRPNFHVLNVGGKSKVKTENWETLHMMYGVSTGTKKLNLICTNILNQENFNQGSNVLYYFHSHTVTPWPGQTVSGKGLMCIPCYKHTLRT